MTLPYSGHCIHVLTNNVATMDNLYVAVKKGVDITGALNFVVENIQLHLKFKKINPQPDAMLELPRRQTNVSPTPMVQMPPRLAKNTEVQIFMLVDNYNRKTILNPALARVDNHGAQFRFGHEAVCRILFPWLRFCTLSPNHSPLVPSPSGVGISNPMQYVFEATGDDGRRVIATVIDVDMGRVRTDGYALWTVLRHSLGHAIGCDVYVVQWKTGSLPQLPPDTYSSMYERAVTAVKEILVNWDIQGNEEWRTVVQEALHPSGRFGFFGTIYLQPRPGEAGLSPAEYSRLTLIPESEQLWYD